MGRCLSAIVVSWLASSLLLAGCAKRQGASGDVEKPGVSISQIHESDSLDYEDFIGRVEAIDSVVIKARATGYLDVVMFKDGDEVKKGALLYQIDDRTYAADLANSEGDVNRYQASLEQYTADLNRAKRMRIGDAISREDYDKIVANKETARASLASAKAAAAKAKLNLEFTRVYAPIDGMVSRTAITKGNLVTQDQTTLTNIVSVAPIYVYFDIPERTVLDIKKRISERKLKSYREAQLPVFVGTEIEQGYPHEGVMDFVDNKLDATTGTLRVRARFANEDRVLVEGMYVRVRVPIGQKQKAILVSDRAVGSDQGQKFLYVVNDKDVVEYHAVRLGGLRDGMRVVESGVKPGDWVIVRGLQKVRQGDVVDAKKVPMPTPPPLPAAPRKDAKGNGP